MVAPVAQLDRASASGVEGHGFESRRVYQFKYLSARVYDSCGFFVCGCGAPRSSSCLQAFPEGNCSSFLYSAGVMPKRFLKLYVIKAAELKPQRAAMDLI